MKIYSELTPLQQEKARLARLNDLLSIAVDGGRFFPELDEKIDAAGDTANAAKTPWFWGEFIIGTCRAEFEDMARLDVECAVFAGKSDFVLTEPSES